MKVKTALISVSDKRGLVEFAKELSANDVKIISSGGTHKAITDAGIDAIKVEEVTKFPEMLDGRVKTLHPNLHGGILARRTPEHLKQLEEHGIGLIDLVVVNLYPFKETVTRRNAGGTSHPPSEGAVAIEEAIEKIDIGGPTIIRAAAKNHESVGVVVDPSQYGKVLKNLKENAFELSKEMKRNLALEAFEHTAFYDATISRYLNKEFKGEKFPQNLSLGFEKTSMLRYGENPHQEATIYTYPLRQGNGVVDCIQLNGKELSFNNYNDANGAIELLKEFGEPCAVIVKHTNPCGVAVDEKLSMAFKKALECDPLSAFGGIIALNRECDLDTAKQITAFFNEVVVAPGYSSEALKELKSKKNLRVLELKNMNANEKSFDFKHVNGGLLVQDADSINAWKWEEKTGTNADEKTKKDLEFAWKVIKHTKSNAILLVKNMATIGLGIGQTSRVGAGEIAVRQAGEKSKASVMASDAFFPFKDSIELAAKAGVNAIVQPGGSLNDTEVIEEAKKKGISLFFTGERHFRH